MDLTALTARNAASPQAALDEKATGRIQPLDGLRGVAILMVMGHHFLVLTPDSAIARYFGNLIEFCSHGVDLFFSISGFLITKQLIRLAGTARGRTAFWVHRLAKIVPLYFACLLFAFLLLPRVLSLLGHYRELHVQTNMQGNWPWYLLFLSNILNAKDGRFSNPAVDVAWSLGVEVQFYAFIFVLFLLLRKNFKYWYLLGLPVAIICRCIAVKMGSNWIQILVLSCNRLDAFALGALVATRSLRFLGHARSIFILALGILAVALGWSRDSTVVETAGYSVVAIAAGFGVSLSVDGGSAAFMTTVNTRFFRLLGAISYPIYLTHVPVRAAIRDSLFTGDRHLGTAASWIQLGIYYILSGTLCIFAGWLLHLYFEKPIQNFIRVGFLKACGPRISGRSPADKSGHQI